MKKQLTPAQEKLVSAVRRTMDCGGRCNEYCCGCPADMATYTRHVSDMLDDNLKSDDILEAVAAGTVTRHIARAVRLGNWEVDDGMGL